MSKTITFNESNISAYIYDNDVPVAVESNRLVVGNPAELHIGDMHSGNATVHENVTAPADWYGGKYLFDGTDWTEVAGWVHPKIAEIARLKAQIDALEAD
tara:strand:+ start:1422 stop:1721 length:300 start_codon:yes stop_codon:yes gene_type:complete